MVPTHGVACSRPKLWPISCASVAAFMTEYAIRVPIVACPPNPALRTSPM